MPVVLSQSVSFPGLSFPGPCATACECSQGISSALQPDSCKLHERGLSWINCPGSSNLVSASPSSAAVLGCSKVISASSCCGQCPMWTMHHVADLMLLVLRLTRQMCAANPLPHGVGPPLLCWVRGSTTCPGREDSIQTSFAGGRSGIVLLPENMVTKFEVVGGKQGSDCF